jgi:hypothetical protein
MDEAIEKIKAEYERCLHPTEEMLRAELYDITDNAQYYTYRAEGLGFALDKLGVK